MTVKQKNFLIVVILLTFIFLTIIFITSGLQQNAATLKALAG